VSRTIAWPMTCATRVSDREKFYIEAHYHQSVTGNLEKSRQVYELWEQTYPRDDIAHFNLSGVYLAIGQFDNAAKEASASLQLLPGDCLSYGNLFPPMSTRIAWQRHMR
jgi:eukaryotic-like serine/threonine-protein kinase